MAKRVIIGSIAVLLIAGGGGCYAYHQHQQEQAASIGKTGQMNTSSIQKIQKQQADREKAANAKHYKIPVIKNHAEQSIKSAKGIPQSASAKFNDGLNHTLAYLSSPDLTYFKNDPDEDDNFVPDAFKLNQYYTSRDAVNAGINTFNQTISKSQDPSAKLPRPGDVYELNTFNISNVKTRRQSREMISTFKFDTTYSIKDNQFKYHLTGTATINEAGQIMQISAKPAK